MRQSMQGKKLTVFKVGGSLYDLPDLGARLRRVLPADAVLVPGGGRTADVVRHFDATHRLGDTSAHWLAVAALSLNARFLQHLLPEACLLATAEARAGWAIVDALPFFRADEGQPGALPHHWDVTSDSLAVRVAHLLGADTLVLLKSVAWHGSWEAASGAGIVDAYFPTALGQTALNVRALNLRDLPA